MLKAACRSCLSFAPEQQAECEERERGILCMGYAPSPMLASPRSLALLLLCRLGLDSCKPRQFVPLPPSPPPIPNPPILRQRHGQSCYSETADILRWLVSGQATALALRLGSDSGEDNIIRMGNDWYGNTSGSGHKLSLARLRHTVFGQSVGWT